MMESHMHAHPSIAHNTDDHSELELEPSWIDGDPET